MINLESPPPVSWVMPASQAGWLSKGTAREPAVISPTIESADGKRISVRGMTLPINPEDPLLAMMTGRGLAVVSSEEYTGPDGQKVRVERVWPRDLPVPQVAGDLPSPWGRADEGTRVQILYPPTSPAPEVRTEALITYTLPYQEGTEAIGRPLGEFGPSNLRYHIGKTEALDLLPASKFTMSDTASFIVEKSAPLPYDVLVPVFVQYQGPRQREGGRSLVIRLSANMVQPDFKLYEDGSGFEAASFYLITQAAWNRFIVVLPIYTVNVPPPPPDRSPTLKTISYVRVANVPELEERRKAQGFDFKFQPLIRHEDPRNLQMESPFSPSGGPVQEPKQDRQTFRR